MPSVAKLRRTWFALCREVGIDDEDRHDVQKAHTGKASLRDWGPDDYNAAIAALQRAAGQHRDRRAHVRDDRPPGPSERGPGWATPKQAAYIEDLANRIEWRVGRRDGPYGYACHTVLAGPENELRRRQIEGVKAPNTAERIRAWLALTRDQASDLIKALRKLERVNPLEVRYGR